MKTHDYYLEEMSKGRLKRIECDVLDISNYTLYLVNEEYESNIKGIIKALQSIPVEYHDLYLYKNYNKEKLYYIRLETEEEFSLRVKQESKERKMKEKSERADEIWTLRRLYKKYKDVVDIEKLIK